MKATTGKTMEPWANCKVEKYAKGQWSVNCCEMGKAAVLAKKVTIIKITDEVDDEKDDDYDENDDKMTVVIPSAVPFELFFA